MKINWSRRAGRKFRFRSVDKTTPPRQTQHEETIMITTRRHDWFIGIMSSGTNLSAFGWTTHWHRLSTFYFCPLVRQNAKLYCVIPSCESNTSGLIVVYDSAWPLPWPRHWPRHGHCFTDSLPMRSSCRRRRTQTNDAESNQLLCDAILASSVPVVCIKAPVPLPAAAAVLYPAHCYVFSDILLETAT